MTDTAPTHSPEETPTTRKRKRKTYSCTDCRRRKLKCDRENPCSRCIKEGHPQSCVFRDDGHTSEGEENDGVFRPYPVLEIEKPGKNANAPNDKAKVSSSFVADQSVNLQRKIALLEAKLARFESVATGDDASGVTSTRPAETETRFFKGTSFKTQFYGQTNPTSLFAHFPEIFVISKDRRSNKTSMPRVQKDLLIMRTRRKERKLRQPVQEVHSLVSLLPSQDTMDHLVQLYFDTYEKIYRITHRPSFWTEYRATPANEWREPFAAIVLMIMASVNCVTVSELSFRDDVSSARVTSQKWVNAVEEWWNRQSSKHLTLEFFQVAILILVAKATNALKRKRAWANSGYLLRIAISAGFQREPSDLSERISVFDQEMRRRIWATLFEWDLAASISRGVPPTAAAIPSDCRAPLNINDIEFGKDSTLLPQPKPLREVTDTSFLQASLQSISLRTSLVSLLNDPNVELSWSEILSYEERIQQALADLPAWAQEKSTMTAVMLDLQLRQYLLWLYAKSTRDEPGPRTAYARMVCVTSSAEMIDLYMKLDAADVNALNMLRYDMYQCIVTISLNLLTEANHASMARSLINGLQPSCEKAFLLLEDKVLKWGEGYNHMWFASASFAAAQTAIDPRLGDSKTVAVERLAKIYYKILAYQESDPEMSAGQTTDTNGASNGSHSHNRGQIGAASWQTTPSDSLGSVTTPVQYADLLKNSGGTLEGFVDFPEMAGWMNDDFFGFDTSFL